MTRYIPLLALLLAAPALAQDIPITFRVDASPLGPRGDALPNLLPGDAFGIRGGVAPIDWSTTTPLADPDGDGIWEATVLFAASEAGNTLNWKAVGDRTASLGSDQPAWEPAPGDPSNFGNRELVIEPQTVNVTYLGLLNDFLSNAQPVSFDYADTYSDDYRQDAGVPMLHGGFEIQEPSCGAPTSTQGDLWYQIDPDLVMGNAIEVTATATGDDLFVDEPTPYVVEILSGPAGGPFSVVDCVSGTNNPSATGSASGVATGAVTYVRVVGLIDLAIDTQFTTPPPGSGTITEARSALGSEVTFTGVVTRAMGDFAYVQDESGVDGTPAAIAIRQTSGPFRDAITSGDIAPGTVLTVTGTPDEFQGRVQVNDANLASYSIGGTTDVPEPQAITAQEARDNGEAYEAELIQIVDLLAVASGTFLEFTYYQVSDASAALPLYIQNREETVFVGTPIPTGAFTYTGVLDQKDVGYRLIPIQEGDLPTATAPEITVSITSLAFGSVTVGDTEELAVTVTNEGNADLAVSAIGVSGNAAFLIVSGDGAGTIEPGGTRDVVVRFSPTTSGPANGSLTITSNDADEGTTEVALSGTGTAPAPTECDYAFAIVNLNGTTVPSAGGTIRYKFQIDNSGNAMAATVDVWATVQDASGDVIFIRTPRTPTIPAGSVYRAGYNQAVHAAAPDGAYTYTVYAGLFNEADPASSEVCGSETFSVTKGDVASKTGASGPLASADWVGVEVLGAEIVGAMALGLEAGEVRVGPNPARERATFAFALASDAHVSLALYDMRGREVVVVANGPMAAGAHTVSLGRALPAGVYTWRLVAGDRVETGRLAVVR